MQIFNHLVKVLNSRYNSMTIIGYRTYRKKQRFSNCAKSLLQSYCSGVRPHGRVTPCFRRSLYEYLRGPLSVPADIEAGGKCVRGWHPAPIDGVDFRRGRFTVRRSRDA